MRKSIALVGVLALFAGSASAELLWDNGMTPNGTNARAVSPPGFPDIRVADDFVVGAAGVTVQAIHTNMIEDGGWTDGGTMTLDIYGDAGGPDGLVATYTGAFTKMDTGDEYFGRTNYDYWLEGIDIDLAAGTYWAVVRNEGGGGAGTNYWMTSDGGADGPGSSTGYFSLDGGATFAPEGDGWDHAFEITGVIIPEPTTCLLLGLGGLALLRRRS